MKVLKSKPLPSELKIVGSSLEYCRIVVCFLLIRFLLIFLCGRSLEENEATSTGFYVIDPKKFEPLLGEDYSWASNNFPFVDFPRNQEQFHYGEFILAYYYRLRLYKKHIEWTGMEDGWVVTEFTPKVSWAGAYNTIPAAAGHHIMEGRWLHNESILNDYISFWYSKRARPSEYTNWIGYASWQRYLLNGNLTFITSILEGLANTYRDVYIPKYLAVANNQTCWKQTSGEDAMENSVSGDGCRPTIASAMYGEADTIIKLAKLTQNAKLVNEFTHWRELSRSIVVDLHWNAKINSFAVIPLRRSHSTSTHASRTCDLSSVRKVNETVNARELLAFMPWYFVDLIPKELVNKFLPMWKELFDPNSFQAKFGLRTVEHRHPCYNYSCHGDCWNGPSWPFETSRILTSFANALQEHSIVNKVFSSYDYFSLLTQYTRQHIVTHAENDTAVPPGTGHIFEELHPDLGYWINRAQMYSKKKPNRNQGNDYNHSTFIDLILSGLLGIRPQEDGRIIINPLIPPETKFFAADHILVRGAKILSIVWDADGSTYGIGKGMTVKLNGAVVAHRSNIGKLVVET